MSDTVVRTFRVGTRPWDHVLPIALGEVPFPSDDSSWSGVELVRSETTPDLWSQGERFALDASETSLSRYLRARAAGDDSVVALPVFLMRGFRHRCLIVRRDSTLTSAAELRGGRVGLTGWPDTGNIWTRALLREDGVGLEEVHWTVGRLTSAHPVTDRLGGVTPIVDVSSAVEPLVELLESGWLDAVMTPFMPPGFYELDSAFRPLFLEPRSAELTYARRHGFVPGIHVLAVRRGVVRDSDDAARIVGVFEQAKELAWARHRKLLDVTPWLNEEIAMTTQHLGDDWMPNGMLANAGMLSALQDEMVAQGLLSHALPLDALFPFAVEPVRRIA